MLPPVQILLYQAKQGFHPSPLFGRDRHPIWAHRQILRHHQVRLVEALNDRHIRFGQLRNQLIHHGNVGLPLRV